MPKNIASLAARRSTRNSTMNNQLGGLGFPGSARGSSIHKVFKMNSTMNKNA